MTYQINLKKGENIVLSKGLSKIRIGLGWDPNASLSKHDYDLDAVALLLNSKDKLATHENFIYFNNLKSKCGSVLHQGDSLTMATNVSSVTMTNQMVPTASPIYPNTAGNRMSSYQLLFQ